MQSPLYFWGHNKERFGLKACLSNWFPSEFKDETGIIYYNMEQWMMKKKAELFGDEYYGNEIMKTNNPKTIKTLGRQIRNFNEQVWIQNREHIVYTGCFLKFSQNLELKDFLLSTGDRMLVEASPFDKIWGIGLNEKDAKSIKSSQWPGLNLLGKCLMGVRENL
jgi:ribA/ribD-fused uncharacterized protein